MLILETFNSNKLKKPTHRGGLEIIWAARAHSWCYLTLAHIQTVRPHGQSLTIDTHTKVFLFMCGWLYRDAFWCIFYWVSRQLFNFMSTYSEMLLLWNIWIKTKAFLLVISCDYFLSHTHTIVRIISTFEFISKILSNHCLTNNQHGILTDWCFYSIADPREWLITFNYILKKSLFEK